jgi:hypothetical protein
VRSFNVAALLFVSWASACTPPRRPASATPARDELDKSTLAGSGLGSRSDGQSDPSGRPPAPERPKLGADFRSTFRKLEGPLRSPGHAGGRWLATKYGNEEGARSYAGEGAPPGSLILSEHSAPGDPGPILVMQKQPAGYDPDHGDWYYAYLEPDLRVLREGKLPDCAACHGLSKRDHLFGAAHFAPSLLAPPLSAPPPED